MSKSGDTISVSLEDARALATMTPGDVRDAARRRLSHALAAHDAAANPLGLPWVVRETGGDPDRNTNWDVQFATGLISDEGLTKAQALLMAAAPDLAGALERLAAARFRSDMHQTYNGGHRDVGLLEAFHQGMDTVCNTIVDYARVPLGKADRI